MSTRCRIGLELPDGKIKSIYCHHDGYPEGVGKMLIENYNDYQKIVDLLELGDISTLGAYYDAEAAAKNWNWLDLSEEERARVRGTTVAYKDRGEDSPARVDDSLWEYLDKLEKCWEEYTYLYTHDEETGIMKWHIIDHPYPRILTAKECEPKD